MSLFTKYQYSRRISAALYQGKINQAIELALEARRIYPEENIFEKMLGDLYLSQADHEKAEACYIAFLKKLGDEKQYFKHFANFVHTYEKSGYNVHKLAADAEQCLKENLISNHDVVRNTCKVIAPYVNVPSLQLFLNDKNSQKAIRYIQGIREDYKRYILYYKILAQNHLGENKTIDKYVVSSMEREKMYPESLELILRVLEYDRDQVAVRTLFRICRKLDDYSEAEKYLEAHPGVKQEEQFNILYELVFYYSKTGDIENRNHVLKKIEKCAKDSIPIMRTLRNFYLQFGLLDEAAQVNAKINNKMNAKNIHCREDGVSRKEQEAEAMEAFLKSFREMTQELEHSRKLISMSELLKGFSHELGQPITNIRYGIQLFQMKMEKGIDTREELDVLFRDILNQLYRIKQLLARFSPVTSEKNELVTFSVFSELNHVFEEFSSRLSKENIDYRIISENDFSLYGDNVKFDQIFYNLIGNSIFAIKEAGRRGKIIVRLQKQNGKDTIVFQDNGTGIAPEYRNKIFEPFFTTKECSSDENGGGEGLGLYIIWNIVQMFDGRIVLDKEYEGGARFVITINKKQEVQK